jgi:hypothetical protein
MASIDEMRGPGEVDIFDLMTQERDETPYLDLVEQHGIEVIIAAGLILRHQPYKIEDLIPGDHDENLKKAIAYVENSGDYGPQSEP